MSTPRLLQIDHVELFVPDRHEAARWYARVLGLQVVQGFEAWAEDPRGPLMISSDDGNTKVALFEGSSKSPGVRGGFHLLAFRTTAEGFRTFLSRLPELQLTDHRARIVTAGSVVDHDQAYSIYFCDLYGNRLELTTYEYAAARAGSV